MKSLHDRAIAFVVKREGGVNNHNNPKFELLKEPSEKKRFSGFRPDVVLYDGGHAESIHEIEVARTKMSKKRLEEYLSTFKWNTPKHRPYTQLWIILPNFKEMQETFDTVHVVVDDGQLEEVYRRDFGK